MANVKGLGFLTELLRSIEAMAAAPASGSWRRKSAGGSLLAQHVQKDLRWRRSASDSAQTGSGRDSSAATAWRALHPPATKDAI